MKYIDESGRTWLPFTASFLNEIDGLTFSFTIYAIDAAHAEDQMHWLRQNGKIDGELLSCEN